MREQHHATSGNAGNVEVEAAGKAFSLSAASTDSKKPMATANGVTTEHLSFANFVLFLICYLLTIDMLLTFRRQRKTTRSDQSGSANHGPPSARDPPGGDLDERR